VDASFGNAAIVIRRMRLALDMLAGNAITGERMKVEGLEISSANSDRVAPTSGGQDRPTPERQD
jgi:hypothetical protein